MLDAMIGPPVACIPDPVATSQQQRRLVRSTSAVTNPRPTVLCVDDDACLLQGVAAVLRRRFDVTIAHGADEALNVMQTAGPFAIVVTDMRMPGLDGVALLKQTRVLYPDTVRILLTGESDVADAARAVNEGEVFRFLTKPCPGQVLEQVLTEAMDHLRQIARGRTRVREQLIALNHAFVEREQTAELRARAAGLGRVLGAFAPTLRAVFSSLLDSAAAGTPPDARTLEALAHATLEVETHSRHLLDLGPPDDGAR
jgi:FixJ family two-component response regulator